MLMLIFKLTRTCVQTEYVMTVMDATAYDTGIVQYV
jgi:hypothetical protein